MYIDFIKVSLLIIPRTVLITIYTIIIKLLFPLKTNKTYYIFFSRI